MASAEAEWCPIYKWGQKKGTVYVTIFVPCLREEAVSLTIRPLSVDFKAARVASFAGGNTAERSYRLRLELRAEVDEAASAYFLRHDHVRLELVKRQPTPWRTLQAAGVPKNPNERPDFDHMGDEEEEEEAEEVARRAKAAGSRPRGGARNPSSRGGALGDLTRFASAAIGSLELWDALPVSICVLFTLLCPFTKVEESFGLQATHDVLYHGPHLNEYDHLDFPGVVPRTFIGAVALAALSAPVALPLRWLGAPKLVMLPLVRLVLGLTSCAAVLRLHRAARRHFGTVAGLAFLLLTSTQFHFLFYASRTLPNTFGGILATLAVAHWIDGDAHFAVRLLVIATVIFRFELCLLLGPLALLLLARRQTSFLRLVANGLLTGLVSLAVTVCVDSVFWGRLLWPEGRVLYANTVLNMSAHYGASPFHWYVSSALPRALLLAAPLSLASLYLEPRARQYVLVPLFFVAAYSFLPHKELRFVIYVVPPLNVAAAAALARIYAMLPSAKARTFAQRARGRVGTLALGGMLTVSAALSLCFLLAARLNYPGAHALLALHRLEAKFGKPRVHIGVDAAMSGVSRFLELPPPWRYSKQEGLAAHDYSRFSHLLVAPTAQVPGFTTLHEQPGYAGIQLAYPFFKTESKIKVLKRRREKFSTAAAGEQPSDFNF